MSHRRVASTALLASILAGFSWTSAHAQRIKVSELAWSDLRTEERNVIQRQVVVELAAPDSFGVIIDNQGVNQSTPGTTGGAQLGALTADAMYLDKAFKGPNWNYSAKENLGYALLGAMIGSAFDQRPVSQFQFRYAVRLGNGDVRYFDQVKADAFRHPVGVCVTVPIVNLTEQGLCTQDAAALRARYLSPGSTAPPPAATTPAVAAPAFSPQSPPASAPPTAQVSPQDLVQCRIGTLAPIRTTAEKCSTVGGTQIQ